MHQELFKVLYKYITIFLQVNIISLTLQREKLRTMNHVAEGDHAEGGPSKVPSSVLKLG